MSDCRLCQQNTLVSPIAKVRPATFLVRRESRAPRTVESCGMHLTATIRHMTIPGRSVVVQNLGGAS